MHISSIKKKMDIILEDCIKLENEISKEKEWEVGGSGLTEEDKQEINNSLLELKSKIDNQDKKIDKNSSQIDEIENNGVKVETVQNTVKELAESGQIQAYTIANESITNEQIKDRQISIEKIESSIQGISFQVNNKINTVALKLKKSYTGATLIRVKFDMQIEDNDQIITITTNQIDGNESTAIKLYKRNPDFKTIDISYTTREKEFNTIYIKERFGNLKGFIKNLVIWINDKLVSVILNENDYIINTTNLERFVYESELNDKLNDYSKNISKRTNNGYHIISTGNYYRSTNYFSFDNIVVNKGDEISIFARIRLLSKITGAGTFLNLKTSDNFSLGEIIFTKYNNRIGELIPIKIDVINATYKEVSNFEITSYGNFNLEIYDLYFTVNGKPFYPIRISSSSDTVVTECDYGDPNSLATKSFVEDLVNGIHKSSYKLPFVNNIYTVKSSENFFGVPIFLDYLYGEYKGTNRIIFDTNNDRQYVYPLRSLNKNIINTKTSYKVKSETLDVSDIKFNHICIDENVNTDNIRLLIIGDSVTAGAITKQQYWSVCAEYFAKEDLIRNRECKFMCLGSNNFRKTEVELNGKTKEVSAGACGISSWSLNNWLKTVSNPSSFDNVGGLNGFTYVENGETKFSILKWVERFRNYDENGNKLELGDGTGTWITENNINKIVCCIPNVVYINSTHNGGSIEEHEKMISIIKEEIPDCKVIVGNPMPLLGTYYPDKYTDEWVDDALLRELPNYGGEGGYLSTRINNLKYYVEKEKKR